MTKPRRQPRILQGELAEYQRLGELCRRHDELRKQLLERLTAGAKVEPGALTASIETRSCQRPSWDSVAQVLGPTEVKLLRERLPFTESKSLKVKPAAELATEAG